MSDAKRWMGDGCASYDMWTRRAWLRAGGLSGLLWLTPLAQALGQLAEREPARPAKSLIILWLAGGPSQLETFDPHPKSKIAGGTLAVPTSVRGIELAAGMPQVAEQMDKIAIVRNVVSKEGDHERAAYYGKTGYRPDPTLVHPALGAVLCHELPVGGAEIPRHISILPDSWPGRGGYLGDAYNAFLVGDPTAPPEDVVSPMNDQARTENRLQDLQFVERAFNRGRLAELEQRRTLHWDSITRARRMMTSEQLDAFNLKSVPAAEVASFGGSAFGRGCLVAARLIQVGVRCVEVTLNGWDSHVNNHETQAARIADLDPALAGLLKYLSARDLLRDTLVLCGGEFGRTPQINPAQGRDHWPHGFSLALAGGGLRGGQVVGETDPDGKELAYEQGHPVADVHATLFKALEIDYQRELQTPVGRPMKICEGRPITGLLS